MRLALSMPPPLRPALELRMLRNLTTIRTAETSLVVLPALFSALWGFLQGFTPAIVYWMLLCIAMSGCMVWARHRLRADEARLSESAVVARWRWITYTIAFTFGLVWVLPLLGWPRMEGATAAIYYVMLCGITAGTAVYVCSVIRAYAFFLAGMWPIAAVELYWVFPGLWYLLAPALLLFCWNTWQHAISMHRFLVEHAELQERSQHLAQGFQRAHEDALAALDEKNRFLSIASHDLRQPLQAMSLLVEAARARNQDARLASLLDDLRSNMASMSQMFNSLLDLSRMETGGITPRPAPMALSDVLRDIERIFKPQALARQLQMRLRLPKREVWVRADPTLLRQVLFNLVHNALRYTERGGLLLAVRGTSHHLRLEIWDTGAGIAADDIGRVFTPYYRGQQAWRADQTGLGLGLAVVARCARLMDNAAHGFRSRLGRGSVFWVQLVETPAPDDAWSPECGPALVHTTASLHGQCLIVDDDPAVRAAYQALLSSWGVDARSAGHATEAFDVIRAGFLPQVILCDQNLRSGESGVKLLQNLLEACPGASGAMVSGEFASPELMDAETEGFVVLRKPVDPWQLHALLTTWLDPVGNKTIA